jgi:hypothetical protein
VQAFGQAGVARRVDVISMAMQLNGTVYDLEESELCYAPQFGAAKDPINMAGMIAGNNLREDLPLADWDQLQTGNNIHTSCYASLTEGLHTQDFTIGFGEN